MVKKVNAKKTDNQKVIPKDIIIDMIYIIRGHKVMLDSDLADLYGVQTGRLNEQVKRNINRFPKDFMFRLTSQEAENLKSQFAISSWEGEENFPMLLQNKGWQCCLVS